MFSFAYIPSGDTTAQPTPFGARSFSKELNWSTAKRGDWTLICYVYDAYGGR